MLEAPTKSILLMIFAYLAGSIPFAYIISLSYGNIDIREHGSGNAGATNVFRILGPLPGLATLLLDALKGFLIVFISLRWIPPAGFGYNYFMWGLIICLISFLAIVGHSYPVWLNFKGGKSVAVSLGVLAALMSWWIFIPIGIFVIMIAITRYVSMGSLTATISVPVIFLTYHTYPHSGNSSDSVFIAFSILMALLVVLRQTGNIKRLLKGTENRFGIKVKKPAEDKTSMVIIPPDEEQNSENE